MSSFGLPLIALFLSTPSARRATITLVVLGDSPCNFYPRPPRGGRLSSRLLELLQPVISIHALREEGDRSDMDYCERHFTDFYPRPPRGGRPSSSTPLASSMIFLSTPSARRATAAVCPQSSVDRISIHALREEGDALAALLRPVLQISIHALREEGDAASKRGAFRRTDFYPRPPRGGRPRPICALPPSRRFLSTPSARRATGRTGEAGRETGNFYPRPPRGGRQQNTSVPYSTYLISIHALREEGDAGAASDCKVPNNFYPRPPRGGRLSC